MALTTLHSAKTALLIIDFQEKLFAAMKCGPEVLKKLLLLIQSFQLMNLPIIITEQCPNKLGSTIAPIKELIKEPNHTWEKNTFSCLDHAPLLSHLSALTASQWLVVGLETHICVLQTAKSLLQAGKEVTVLADVTTSRFENNCTIALNEMRQEGIRISSLETVLFELLKDSNSPFFKPISQLVKTL